ncbi:MAG: adenylosuccinate lyase, partial [bacterium]
GKDNDLLDRIAADPAFHLTKEDLANAMVPAKYVGRAPKQVENYLTNIINPLLEDNKDFLGQTEDIKV